MTTATDEQPTLFDPATRPVTFIQYCHLCGQPVTAVPLDDASKPWMPPVLWCYAAQKRHEHDHHPEQEATP